jgi:hypothetical protein
MHIIMYTCTKQLHTYNRKKVSSKFNMILYLLYQFIISDIMYDCTVGLSFKKRNFYIIGYVKKLNKKMGLSEYMSEMSLSPKIMLNPQFLINSYSCK